MLVSTEGDIQNNYAVPPKTSPKKAAEKSSGCTSPAPSSNIYSAVYSGVPVYEMMCRNVAVMRRRADSFLNATQILKVAGIDKGRRTKILEKEILNGEHEKVQGGYGKYQGTWIPYERGVQLAHQYNVDVSLKSILEFEPPPLGKRPPVLKKEQFIKQFSQKDSDAESNLIKKNKRSSSFSETARKKSKSNISSTNFTEDLMDTEASSSFKATNFVRNSSMITSFGGLEQQQQPDYQMNPERHRATLMSIFLNENPNYVPELLTMPNPPMDLNVDLVIDEQGHSCLHWAAALARVNILRILVSKNVDITKRNFNGETALIRAVLVTNNFDNQTFHYVVDLLQQAIPLVDQKNRTVLHHIALTAAIKGRSHAARYYMECLLERIARNDGDFASIVDVQDKNGDTALNIASRIGNKSLIEQLLDVGADPNIENRAGLRPCDFGIDAFSVIHRSKMGEVDNNTEVIINQDIISPSLDVADFIKNGVEQNNAIGNDSLGFDKRIDTNISPNNRSKDGFAGPKIIFPTIVTEKDVNDDGMIGSIMSDSPAVISENLKTKGKEVTESIQKMIENITKEFIDEMLAKDDTLKETQKNLREITVELAQLRRTNALLKQQNNNIPEMLQRIQNLELYLTQEMAKNAMIMLDDPSSNNNNTQDSNNTDMSNTIFESSEINRLNTLISSHITSEKNLREQIVQLKGQVGENELKFKRIISACAGVPLDSVDELIDSLLAAVESDQNSVNVAQIAGFMNKVRSEEENAKKS